MSQLYYIFSDASYNKTLGIGVGAVLIVSQAEWAEHTSTTAFEISTQTSETHSIARLELLTVLWALDTFKSNYSGEIKLFTDSQTVAGLGERRNKLEACDFISKRSGKLLTNADLYRRFYAVTDSLRPTIEWTEGHSPSEKRTRFARAFAQVDRAARQKLREHVLAKNIGNP